jgi:hypothetical protein
MKTSTTVHDDTRRVFAPHYHVAAAARAVVDVEFLPLADWQIEVGRVPAKTFPSPQSMRDNGRVTRYKRPHGKSRLPQAFVPVELVIGAGEKRAVSGQRGCPVTLP